MKKIIMIIFVILTTLTVEAGIVDSTLQTVQDKITEINTSSVSQQVYQDVKDVLKGLAEGLKTTSEYVFKVMILKYVITGITQLLIGLLALFGVYSSFKELKTLGWQFKAYYEDEYSSKDEWRNLQFSAKNILYIGLIGISAYFGINLITDLPTTLMYIFNPGYFVITDIIDMVKTLK